MAQMERWLDALCAEIGGDRAIVDAHRDEILRLISTVAHGPSRPGAPMTGFVLGWAAATTGGDISELAARLGRARTRTAGLSAWSGRASARRGTRGSGRSTRRSAR